MDNNFDMWYKISIQSWGQAGWVFLRSVALMYPLSPTATDKTTYFDFFQNIGNILPCEVCRKHYNLAVKTDPIDLSSRRTVAEWIHGVENKVNQSRGREIVQFTTFIAEFLPPQMYHTVSLDAEEHKLVQSMRDCIIKRQKLERGGISIQSDVPMRGEPSLMKQSPVITSRWMLRVVTCLTVLMIFVCLTGLLIVKQLKQINIKRTNKSSL